MRKENSIDSREVEKEDLKVIGSKIGNNIVKLRNRDNLSLKDLIKKTNISRLKEIEEAKEMLSLDEARMLAKVFNVSLESIALGDSL